MPGYGQVPFDPQNRLEATQRLASQLSGNIEQKRTGLYEVKLLETEWASRLAVPLLSDPDEVVRATAAGAVISLPRDEAAALLGPLLDDKAEFVRREAAWAIGEAGSTRSTAKLIGRLRSEALAEVRSAIIIALGKIGDPSAVAALVAAFRTQKGEGNEFIRRSAARSLGQIAQIVADGERQVVTPQSFLPGRYKDLPPANGDRLVQRFPQFSDAVRVLELAAASKRESRDVQREAAFALGAIGESSSAAVLRQLLGSADPYVAETAKEALVKIEAKAGSNDAGAPTSNFN